ncbi:MAG: AarF/ABC1/UbiB kinase family protein [Microcoleus vaginatus WJT46-NPBG5]|jgi:predicted unusual protein kinase regulating ubiquinone biosynthesis (AarF/ABC1/UbiB family)|nr:AarF/ABC1/UbiB kinase family protein [Microcoleus vaginatus WJT46-NPBG5]
MDVKTVSPTSAQLNSATMTEQPISTATTQEASSAVATITVESERIPRVVELTDIVVPVPADNFSSDALQYDAVAINEYYSSRPLPVWRRRLSIVSKLASFGLNLWWDRQTGRLVKNQPARAEQLRKMLTQLGPAFIKIGQALSTRPDLVPPGYLEELAKLQDQLPPFPNKIAYQFIEEELGAHPNEIYAELSPEPVAAASLGQVYKGKLKTGETVAVKVQRPGLAESITLDVYILRRLAGWAQRNMKQVRSDLVAIADEFAARLFEEMDYTHEGHNAERFAELYGHLKDIYVPKIYWPYTGRRVLTMEWIDGTKLTNLESLSAQGIDASYLIDLGVQCSLRQLLEHGFFHADPHPGNLMATRDGQLAYLDFGMMSEVKPYQRYGLIQAIVHLVNRDFEGLAHDYVKLEFLTPDTDLTPIIPALAGVFGNALGASVAELNFKSITDELSQVMYDYPFRVPAYYALIIRSLVTLEGIAINVDPNFKVLSKAYPYVAKRLLTDPSPELRSSLRDLLFKEGSFRWNRLENLLKNAKSSDDYDISQALNQALEFLFSERGDFIRDYLIDEIVKSLDTLSRQSFQNATSVVGEWFGLRVNKPAMTPAEEKNMEHFQRIWGILQETKGFDPVKVASVLPQLILKPETQRMGKQIAGGLAQRALARLIRDVLLREEPIKSNGHNGSQQRALSLPAQRTK